MAGERPPTEDDSVSRAVLGLGPPRACLRLHHAHCNPLGVQDFDIDDVRLRDDTHRGLWELLREEDVKVIGLMHARARS